MNENMYCRYVYLNPSKNLLNYLLVFNEEMFSLQFYLLLLFFGILLVKSFMNQEEFKEFSSFN